MDGDTPTWHVDSPGVRQTTALGAHGNGLVSQWIVPYVIDSGPAKGTTHEVTVPAADFTPESVKSAITDHLSNVHGVASLSG
jgi:hypothetical protein